MIPKGEIVVKMLGLLGLGDGYDQWCIGGGVYADIRRKPTSGFF